MPTTSPQCEFIPCPRCERLGLTEKDFGICRARKTGRNLYCRTCARESVEAGRQRVREYKASRIKIAVPAPVGVLVPMSPRRIARLLRKLTPTDRVLEAIRSGVDTYTEIARATKLPQDEVGNQIADLLLVRLEIGTDDRSGERRYFIRAPDLIRKPMVLSAKRKSETPNYGVSTIYSEW